MVSQHGSTAVMVSQHGSTAVMVSQRGSTAVIVSQRDSTAVIESQHGSTDALTVLYDKGLSLCCSYRRVAGDTCQGGDSYRYDPDRITCPIAG